MLDIKTQLDEQGKGSFYVDEGSDKLAEMVVRVDQQNLTVYHTEVSDRLKGQGVATTLLEHMVAYARQHKLKVIPLCPFVSAQFKRHPETYQDIWKQDWH